MDKVMDAKAVNELFRNRFGSNQLTLVFPCSFGSEHSLMKVRTM